MAKRKARKAKKTVKKKTGKKTVKKMRKNAARKRAVKRRNPAKKRTKRPVKKKAVKKRAKRPAKKKKAVKKKAKKPVKKQAKRKKAVRKKKTRPKKHHDKQLSLPEAEDWYESHIDKHIEKVDEHIEKYKDALDTGKKVEPIDVFSAIDVEKAIRKDIRAEFGRSEAPPSNGGLLSDNASLIFYFVSSLIAVMVLAFLFGTPTTGVFYFVFGMFLWWWSHHIHLTRSSVLKAFLALGSILVILYVATFVLDDLLSIIVCVIYALSMLIGGFLYFYHVKRELSEEIHRSLPRTFLVVFYSQMMAFTAAALVAYLLSFLLTGERFISIIIILLAWLLPALLVYFFLTKFLYLRFFDRKHIHRDLKKGLKHGIAYCALFMAVIIFAYLLTAIQFAGSERAEHISTLDASTSSLQSVRQGIIDFADDNGAGDIIGLKVTNDLLLLSDQTADSAAALRQELDMQDLSASDYFTDNYFTIVSHDRMRVSETAGSAYAVSVVRNDLFREYLRLRSFEDSGEFDDGSLTLEEHLLSLSEYVNTAYIQYEEPASFRALRDRVDSSRDSYTALLADERLLEFNLAYHPDMSIFMDGDSRFSKRLYDMAYHTSMFRDLMVLALNSILQQARETVDPMPVSFLYESQSEESTESAVLRYRIIKSNFDATLSLFE